MPNIASAKKRMRQNVVRRDLNRGRRSKLRTALRRLNEAIEAGDIAQVREHWTNAQSLLDRTARHGVIHPNKAARTKARLTKRVRQLEQS